MYIYIFFFCCSTSSDSMAPDVLFIYMWYPTITGMACIAGVTPTKVINMRISV